MSKYFLHFLCFNLKHGLLFLRFPLEKNKTKTEQNKPNIKTNKQSETKTSNEKKKTIKTKYYQVRIPGQLCERRLPHRPRRFYECLKFPGFVLQPVEEKNKENLNPLRQRIGKYSSQSYFQLPVSNFSVPG